MTDVLGDSRLKCPDCGKQGSAFDRKCSSCGRVFSKQEIASRLETKSDGQMLVGCGGLLAIAIGLGFWLIVPSAEEKAAKVELAAMEKRQAKHCLSPLDGGSFHVNRYLSVRMRNPKSYEHIYTNVTEVGADGNHEFIVNFRAENGFGGMNSGMAVGKFKNENCHVVEARIVDTN